MPPASRSPWLGAPIPRRPPDTSGLADPGSDASDPDDPGSDASGHPRPERRPLIRAISLQALPDTFTGILGPSGAGKSTLLNCLAGYLAPDRGRLVFDGGRDAYEETDTYRSMMGHVAQDDVVFRSLSIRENLDFAARLRLGRDVGTATIDEAVGRAMGRVGLAEHADKPVAVLSGGQRKRLSVAIELLKRPRLLLLDEPTSGLDPAGEAHLMEQLRHLARRGTTVICTTHLMDNLPLLDRVIALGVVDGVGRLAYAGPPDGLLPRFGCRRFADLYEVLASGRFEPVAARPDPSPAGTVGPGSGTDTRPSANRPGIARPNATLAADTGWGQLMVLARRGFLLSLRDRPLILAMVAQPVILGLLVALSQYDASKPFPILFLGVVIAIWLGLNNSARDLVRDRRHYVRDRLAGLRPTAYLGARTLVHAAFGLGQILILLVVLRVGSGLAVSSHAHALGFDITPAKDLGNISMIWLTSVLMLAYLGGVGLGLLVSTLARTEEAAVAALPLLIMPQLLIGAMATGVQDESYTRARPFRPLVVTFASGQGLTPPAAVADLLSLACLSRPAALVAEAPTVGSYGRWTWAGDLCHLMILLLGTWTMVFVAFQWSERRWLGLIGL